MPKPIFNVEDLGSTKGNDNDSGRISVYGRSQTIITVIQTPSTMKMTIMQRLVK